MSRVKKIDGYQAGDGTIFETKTEAEVYQAELDFNEWYESNRIMGDSMGSYVDLPEIKAWLRENQAIVKWLLEGKPFGDQP